MVVWECVERIVLVSTLHLSLPSPPFLQLSSPLPLPSSPSVCVYRQSTSRMPSIVGEREQASYMLVAVSSLVLALPRHATSELVP